MRLDRFGNQNICILSIAVGVCLRLLISPAEPVYATNLIFWKKWLAYSVEHGIIDLYAQSEFLANYPPLYPTFLWIIGSVGFSVFGPAFENVQVSLVKLPAIGADTCIGLMLRRVALRLPTTTQPAHLFPESVLAAWMFNPVVFYLSSFWGQVDSIHTAFLTACLICTLDRRWAMAGIWFGLALLTKFQSIVLCPLLLLLALRGGAGATVRATGVTALTIGLGLAPFILGGGARVLESYTGAAGLYPRLTVGADNLWTVVQYGIQRATGAIPHDDTAVLGQITFFGIGLAIFAAHLIVVLYGFVHRRNKRPGTEEMVLDVFLCAGILYFSFYMLPTQMHERYLFPAFAFLLLPAWQMSAMRRIYVLLCISTFATFVLVVPPAEGFRNLVGSVVEPWKLRVLIGLLNSFLLIAVTWAWIVPRPQARPG